jgi:hypothetical protein
LSSDLSDPASLIEALIKLIKLLHEISDKEFTEIVAAHKATTDPFGQLRPDPPARNSLNIDKVLDLQRLQSQTIFPVQRQGDSPGSEVEECKNRDELAMAEVDSIARFFSRNERFFSTLARYSTSHYNKFTAAVQELRRCRDCQS